jgi:hypothetical protein
MAPKVQKETKTMRFERIAMRRVTEALRQLRLIGNLSNKQTYDYSEQHIRQIFDALETELRRTKSRFKHGDDGREQGFSFQR